MGSYNFREGSRSWFICEKILPCSGSCPESAPTQDPNPLCAACWGFRKFCRECNYPPNWAVVVGNSVSANRVSTHQLPVSSVHYRQATIYICLQNSYQPKLKQYKHSNSRFLFVLFNLSLLSLSCFIFAPSHKLLSQFAQPNALKLFWLPATAWIQSFPLFVLQQVLI